MQNPQFGESRSGCTGPAPPAALADAPGAESALVQFGLMVLVSQRKELYGVKNGGGLGWENFAVCFTACGTNGIRFSPFL